LGGREGDKGRTQVKRALVKQTGINYGAVNRRVLDECDRAARMERGRKPSLLLYRVVSVDEDTTLWPACDLGNPRLVLNTLVRAFGMRD